MTSPWERLVALTWGATEAVIAAPYIKEHSLRRLLEQLTQLEQFICVTRWQAREIATGVSDTAVRGLVRSLAVLSGCIRGFTQNITALTTRFWLARLTLPMRVWAWDASATLRS